ncbi:MAG: hypothetical protein JWO10_1532 [Microbacteriaceae bacterium]|nr:hypothetical protein [Microbacteriaceae bacterium]
MVLRIDPSIPLVWRTPNSLQLGIDAPAVVLDRVSTAQEHILAALMAGISRSGIEMIARTAHAAPGELQDLLCELEPALDGTGSSMGAAAVHLPTSGETSFRLQSLLQAEGVGIVKESEARFAVIAAHYVLAPEQHGRWLRRDVPHLPVIYGDSIVRIGPFIEPGTGPCLFCLELHHTDSDAAWPAIASQLWGRQSPIETPLVCGEVAAIITRLILARLRHGPSERHESIELDAVTGDRTVKTWAVHPECGCQQVPLPAAVSEDPAGTSTASAQPRAPIRFSTTTGAGLASLV